VCVDCSTLSMATTTRAAYPPVSHAMTDLYKKGPQLAG